MSCVGLSPSLPHSLRPFPTYKFINILSYFILIYGKGLGRDGVCESPKEESRKN